MPAPIIVVSGLPRSGTSMMMRGLALAGVPVATTDHRPADRFNPFGYFEYEPVRAVAPDWGWLSQLRGHAVKIVAPLVATLPPGESYRVLFMRRDLETMFASQAALAAGRGVERLPDPEGERALAALEERAVTALSTRPDTGLKCVAFEEMLADPWSVSVSVVSFLEQPMDPVAMADAVDPATPRFR